MSGIPEERCFPQSAVGESSVDMVDVTPDYDSDLLPQGHLSGLSASSTGHVGLDCLSVIFQAYIYLDMFCSLRSLVTPRVSKISSSSKHVAAVNAVTFSPFISINGLSIRIHSSPLMYLKTVTKPCFSPCGQ